jgi:hypothetical protein
MNLKSIKMKNSEWRNNLINDKKDPRLMVPRPYPGLARL